MYGPAVKSGRRMSRPRRLFRPPMRSRREVPRRMGRDGMEGPQRDFRRRAKAKWPWYIVGWGCAVWICWK